MFSLELVLSVKFGVRLAIALLLLIKYIEEKTSQVKWWSIAWFWLGLSDLTELFLHYNLWLPVIKHVCFSLSGVAFFISSCDYLAYKYLKHIIAAATVLAIGGAIIFSAYFGWFWAELYSSIFLAVGLGYAAFGNYRKYHPKLKTADYLINGGFALWGIFVLFHAFGQTIYLTQLKYLVVLVFVFPFGWGLVLKSGEALRQRLIKKTKELKQAHVRLIENERVSVIGQMAAMVSHELKNPLMGMKTAAFYIKRNLDHAKPDLVKAVEDIELEILYSENIIGNILSFSRPPVPVFLIGDVNQILKDTVTACKNQRLTSNIAIETYLTPLPETLFDAAQLRQAISNLMLNAVQSIGEGGRVVITSRENNGNIEVEIKDTGCGIADTARPKLYTPFFTTKARGTGLGLCIVKNIIERHGGNIKLETRPGEGTSAVFTLPVMRRK